MVKLLDKMKWASSFPLLLVGTTAPITLIGINMWLNSGAGDLISRALDIPINSVRANYVVPTILLLTHAILKLQYSKNGLDDAEKQVLRALMYSAVLIYVYFISQYTYVVYYLSSEDGNYIIVKDAAGAILSRMSKAFVFDTSAHIGLALIIDFAATASAVLAVKEPEIKAVPPPGPGGPSGGGNTGFFAFETAVNTDMGQAKTLMMNPAASRTALETKLLSLRSKLSPPSGVTVDPIKWADTKINLIKMISELEVEIGKKP